MRIETSAQALLDPVAGPLAAGVARLGVDDDVDVGLAEVPGFWALDGDRVLLHEALARAEGHPDDAGGPDRWRRATGSVLEALVVRSLPHREPAWLATGLAVHRVDRLLPELGLAPSALAAARGGDLVAAPRGGLAVLRAWEAAGLEVEGEARRALEQGVDVRRFVEAGLVVLREGLDGLPPAVDVPARLGPWSWARLEVAAHPRGGRVRVRGRGGVVPSWAPAGRVFRGLAGACGEGVELITEAGGPVGDWEVRSAQGGVQVLGARGVVFGFRPSGRLEVVLADAYVGSVAEVEAARALGTSGVVQGRWSVEGPYRLRLREIVPVGVTVHGRKEGAFAVPGEGTGLAAGIQAMQDGPWAWRQEGDGLRLEGSIGGASVVVVLRRATPSGGGST